MPLEYWLTIHFRKVLTLLFWEIKKAVKTLITFSFLFLQKLYLTGLLTNILRALISMTLKINTKWKKMGPNSH